MKCKNCEQKEAFKYSKYSKGEFCSRECARAYSTKVKRKEINEKVSKKLMGRKLPEEHVIMMMGKGENRYNFNITDEERENRKNKIRLKKEKKCESCGCEIDFNNKVKYCKICSSYWRNKELFEKLGVLEQNLQISNQNALKILSKEYFSNKKGLIQIKEEYGIMFNTFHFFFKKNGVDLRTLSKSIKLAVKEGRLVPSLNKRYETGYHITWYGKKVFYRSSYERRMMEILDIKQEMYFYETIRVEYEFKNEVSVYITDFYLPEKNLIIEIKGEWFQKRDKEKIEAKKRAVLSEGYYYMMLGKKELEQYENGMEV